MKQNPRQSQGSSRRALAQSRAQLEGIVTSAMDAIISVDEAQRIILFNPAAEKMFDVAAAEVLGKPLDVLLPARFRAVHRGHFAHFGTTGTSTRVMGALGELWGIRRDGTEFEIEASISQIQLPEGKVFTAIVRDIHERKHAGLELERRAMRLKALNDVLASILAVESAEAIAQIVLGHLSGLLPYTGAVLLLPDLKRREVLVITHPRPEPSAPPARLPFDPRYSETGKWLSELGSEIRYAGQYASDVPQSLQQRLGLESSQSYMTIPLRVQGRAVGVVVLSAAERVEPGPSELGTARQVGDILAVALEQARLRQVVNTTRERLQELARRQSELVESERRQMTRDLHDMVGQNLTALNLNLQVIATQLPPEASLLQSRLDDSSALVEEIVKRIRSMMAELRPSLLDDFGLAAALRWYGIEYGKRTGVPVEVEVEDLEPRLPSETETALFRITQEALTNVAKHARATLVLIRLGNEPDRVLLEVQDNGVGFDFPTMRRDRTKNGVGLVDMRERAEAVGGRIWVECATGKGTLVSIEIPR